ncbi:MAG TPA: FG-GAP-like repeat-containing protein [Candidatus Koribacter sp.]|jgi:hypothetical protein
MYRRLLLAVMLLCGLSLFAQTYNFTPYTTSGYATWNTVADFNRDGYPDIAVSNEPADGSGSGAGTVDIFLNNVDAKHGNFGTPVTYAIPSFGPIIAVDVNGDRWPDLLIAGQQTGGNTILLNNGDGTFRMGVAPITKAVPIMFVAGDFNNNGRVDLAAVESDGIEILKNNGSGTFTSVQTIPSSGKNAVVRDFDGDGHLDIAFTNGTSTFIYWGSSNGTFNSHLTLSNPSSDPLYWVASADFNNDGRYDLAVTSNHPCSDPTNFCGVTTAHVYKNLGSRKFSLVSSNQIGDDAYAQIYTADVNSDLNEDLVALNDSVWDGQISYRPGNGNNTFGTEAVIEGTTSVDLAFADLNLDSKKDLVYPEFFPSGAEVVGIATSGNRNCTGLGSATLAAKFCEPTDGANAVETFPVKAAGNGPLGVRRLELWIDGVKVYEKLGDQMNHKVTLTPGQHRLVVVAIGEYTGTATAVSYITVVNQ